MRVKERDNALSGILRRGLMVADADYLQRLEHHRVVVIEERVSSIGILFYVVGHAHGREYALQLSGDTAVPAVLRAIAADNGTRFREKDLDIFRQRSSIVDAGRGESVPGGEHQGEAAAHAEADDT